MQNTHANIIQVIHDYIADPETDWRIGEHAQFSRDAEEEVEISLDYTGGTILSETGMVRITVSAMTRLVPAEGLAGDLWVQAGLLCLREVDAAMSNRSVLTELGNDLLAARPIDTLATLFDLGRGYPHVDVCVRTADKALGASLRERVGSTVDDGDPLFDAFTDAEADFVVTSRLGRIESFGRNRTPGRPLELAPPAGYLNCLTFAPPRPDSGGEFDEATYGAFRVLHGIFAEPALARLKSVVSDALRAGAGPETVEIDGEEARLAVAVLLRQLAQRDGTSENLSRWRSAIDA